MSENAAQKSLVNLQKILKWDDHFPENVFRGEWKEFFFFDPDWLFDATFVENAKALLNWEGGACACVCNMDQADAKGDPQQAVIFLDKDTSGETYRSTLAGPSPGVGWIFGMERYGITSDVGNWCIYCEKDNEIAVIAIREGAKSRAFESVIQSFNALPIERAIAMPPSYGLLPRSLRDDWRKRFLAVYGKKDQ